MSSQYRIVFLSVSLCVLMVLGYFVKGNITTLFDDFWFTSGLLLLILLSLVDQPYFSKHSNVFLNSIAAGISLLLVVKSERDQLFWTFTVYVLYLALSSYFLMWRRTKLFAEEPEGIKLLSRLNRIVGRPEALFSVFFLWGAFKQFGYSSDFNLLLLYWVVFMIFDIPNIAKSVEKFLRTHDQTSQKSALGTIFGVHSKNIFLIKLYGERPTSRVFDFVEFKYSIDQRTRKGLIIDIYLLNEEQWIKVLYNSEIDIILKNATKRDSYDADVVYRIANPPENDYLEKLIGIVTQNSKIGIMRFVYNSKVGIAEGQLLQVSIRGSKILYQVIEGITKIEKLERKNESAHIVGEAIQLGTWDKDHYRFDQFGWVPNINSPVYLSEDVDEPKLKGQEIIVGRIPNTNFPIILDKELAITHHTAVLGVTGTGKSVFARNLVREFLKSEGIKVICIDFTKEYDDKFSDISHGEIVPPDRTGKIFKCIDWLSTETDKFPNQQNKDLITRAKKRINYHMLRSIISFIKSNHRLSIFELPDVSNTSGILEYTKLFFENLFLIARERRSYNNKICVVLEEAHTVIPEWNFIGIAEKRSQSLVNNISQIALQGRKYDIGFLVIAQRTANVSKTVLTQCNSVVSFQEFDKTSSDFLANYFGEQMANVLPYLKPRQAVAAGKAFKSNVPLIFQVPEIEEV